MTIYRNNSFTSRNYECINIVYQTTDGKPRNYNGTEAPENWTAVDDMPAGLDFIGGFGGHKFYGYL